MLTLTESKPFGDNPGDLDLPNPARVRLDYDLLRGLSVKLETGTEILIREWRPATTMDGATVEVEGCLAYVDGKETHIRKDGDSVTVGTGTGYLADGRRIRIERIRYKVGPREPISVRLRGRLLSPEAGDVVA